MDPRFSKQDDALVRRLCRPIARRLGLCLDDLAQEVAIQFARSGERVTEERARQVANDRAIDMFRHGRALRRDVSRERSIDAAGIDTDSGWPEHPVAATTSPSGVAVAAELVDGFRRGVDALGPRDSELAQLRLAGTSWAEVGQILGMSHANARKLGTAALRRLASLCAALTRSGSVGRFVESFVLKKASHDDGASR